jgi:hypothetical protein
LRAIGAIHIAIAQEFRNLQARIKAATPLLEMANSPFYRESPQTEKRLDAKQKNFLFLPCDPPKEDYYRFVNETFSFTVFADHALLIEATRSIILTRSRC